MKNLYYFYPVIWQWSLNDDDDDYDDDDDDDDNDELFSRYGWPTKGV